MTQTVDYYFALASPWSYLGQPRVVEIAKCTGAKLNYKPVDPGRVFPAAGTLRLKDRPPARKAYRMMELKRWRAHLGMELTLEPKFFPVNESLAAHMVIAARQAGHDPGPLVLSFMRAIWVEERNIADAATMDAVAESCGFVGAALRAAAEGMEAEAEYDANCEEAIGRQVFGLPTYVLNNELFWGQDRLEFLERALRAR
ncbi:MAG: DsbA family protein [Alphaproteobacteria bacterium]